MVRRFIYTEYIIKQNSFNSIVTSKDHNLVLQNNNTTWVWGYNNYGQLGDNTTDSRRTPVSINLQNVCVIDCGVSDSSAIDNTGLVWTWGYNLRGQLGNFSTLSKKTPVSILGAKKTFCQISSGNNSKISIDKDGQIWSWGSNLYGVLGDNTLSHRCTPVSILGAKKTFCKISQGNYSVSSIDKDGQIWSWGINTYGQLGDSVIVSKLTPVSILGAKKTFCKISRGDKHILAIDQYGQIWSWGYNGDGRLGNNSAVNRCTPVSILGFKKTFCKISAGNGVSTAIDQYGQIWTWGNNLSGQLGDNKGDICAYMSKRTPVTILGAKKTFCHITAGGLTIGAFTNNAGHVASIDRYGQIWSWGYNIYGQLGNDSNVHKTTPIKVYPKDYPTGLKIGDQLSGGTIAYILKDGDTGYNQFTTKGIITYTDTPQLGNAEWGCSGVTIATHLVLGSGLNNTNLIVSGCTNIDIAARICYDFTGNSYEDWYLPSRDELYKVYFNKNVLTQVLSLTSNVWSSSQQTSNNAISITFSTGGFVTTMGKSVISPVIAVRNFST